MAGLCEGGNEPPGSLKANELCPQQVGEVEAIRLSRRTVVRRLQYVRMGYVNKPKDFRFNKQPPRHKQIYQWHRKFVEGGCICKQKSMGRPRTSNENVERIRTVYQSSPFQDIGLEEEEEKVSQVSRPHSL
ncbi:hypothetical protein ANN_24352 [Periplaneta americana]|uniref:DUF4817 domain-containing protein n=1 Tax=Periplaneta americana TaxID=6978 RepID=A0ABQ8S2V9_PERAM|nr:hypothetical protein ANN_24352 [Periplaneta americana]